MDEGEQEKKQVTSEFMVLVDEWLIAHPVKSYTYLKKSNLRFAAAKVLILHSQRASAAKTMQDGGARLAAVLLILFVHEGLKAKSSNVSGPYGKPSASSTGEGEPQILGVSMSTIFQMVKDTIRLASLTRNDMLDAVWAAELDPEGSTVALVQSQQLSAELFTQGEQQHGAAAGPAVGRPSLRALWASRQTARVLLRTHTWLIVLGGGGTAMWASLWPHRFGTALWTDPSGRTATCALGVVLSLWALVNVFPEDLESKAGARMIFPLATTQVLGSTLVVCYGYLQRGESYNPECEAVHLVLCVGVVCNGAVSLALCFLGRFSWAAVRVALVVDGLLFCASVVALRVLGPPPGGHYPPGGAPFPMACTRGALPLFLGLVLTGPCRRGIVRTSRSLGVQMGVRVDALLCAMVDALDAEGDGATAVVESAGIDDWGRLEELRLWGSGMERMMRRQLAQRYIRLRLLLCALIGTWFALAENLHLWRHVAIFGTDARMLVFGCVAVAMTTVITSTFPTDINSPSARRFLLPIGWLVAGCTGFYAWQSFYRDGLATHVNPPCKFVHASTCILSTAVWTGLAVCCSAAGGSWGLLRLVLVLDGMVFILCALAMRHLGPPPFYLPHNVSFAEAVLRSATTPALALCLTAGNRHRIAALANRGGLNHVSVTLTQVEQAWEHGGSCFRARPHGRPQDGNGSHSSSGTLVEWQQ